MKNNKQYKNKLHIPPLSKDNMESIQNEFCNGNGGCTKHCEDCLFDEFNTIEFTEWFNEKFKANK